METFGFSKDADIHAVNTKLVKRPGYLGVAYTVEGLLNFDVEIDGDLGIFNALNDLDDNQAKTITIIVKNTTALTWPVEFAWVDNIPPTLQPSTTLVVTGIYASNASSATYTGGKVLCTFSYYTV